MELFFAMIAWIFGILSGLYFKISIVLFIVFMFAFYLFIRKNRYLKLLCSKKFMIIFTLCYIISYFQIIYLEKSFEEKYQFVEQKVQVVGTIISNPSYKEYKTVYTIKVESVNGNDSYKNTNLLLNIKKEKNQKEYKYGNKISFVGTFEQASRKRNEGGFDYKQYLKTNNIYGIVETKLEQIKLVKENNSNIISKLANTVANKIQKKAEELLEKKEASVLTGILIGNKENLEENIKELFRKSNLSHMLAVSGAHVSYIIMGIGFVVSNLKVSKRSGKIITIIILLFFMLITGKTPSVTRACFMTIYMILASLFHKRVSVFSSISISMILLMILNPYCIFDVGMQLSYGGTIGIVVLYKILNQYFKRKDKIEERVGIKEYLHKVKIKIREMTLITISANIILIPIILYHFNTLSLIFLLSNLLASPIMGILVLLGFLTIIVSFIFNPFGKILSTFLEFFLKLFLQIATITGNLPLSQILIATPKLQCIILYYFIIFLFVYYLKINGKRIKRRIEKKILKKVKIKTILIMLLIITVIAMLYHRLPSSTLKIYFIDVGQGDSTLIVTPNKNTILIDGGGSKEKEAFNVGESTLLPYLLDRGVIKLDYILISHFDSDHVRTDF